MLVRRAQAPLAEDRERRGAGQQEERQRIGDPGPAGGAEGEYGDAREGGGRQGHDPAVEHRRERDGDGVEEGKGTSGQPIGQAGGEQGNGGNRPARGGPAGDLSVQAVNGSRNPNPLTSIMGVNLHTGNGTGRAAGDLVREGPEIAEEAPFGTLAEHQQVRAEMRGERRNGVQRPPRLQPHRRVRAGGGLERADFLPRHILHVEAPFAVAGKGGMRLQVPARVDNGERGAAARREPRRPAQDGRSARSRREGAEDLADGPSGEGRRQIRRGPYRAARPAQHPRRDGALHQPRQDGLPPGAFFWSLSV